MKWLSIFFILPQIVLAPQISQAAQNFSETFTLTVTIPAVIGLNVPVPEEPDQTPSVVSNTAAEIILEDAIRDHQNVTLKTVVVR